MKKVLVLLSVASMFAFASCSEPKVEEKAPEATNETTPAVEVEVEATEAVEGTEVEATETEEGTEVEATEAEETHEEHAH